MSEGKGNGMHKVKQQVVLAIDDNVTNLKVAISYLQTHGLEVIIARNGEKGIERARFARPDLILLDVRMPGMDGFETCRRLKADDSTRDIPIIFMTALSDVEDKVRGFEAGGVDYITKPIQAEEVWARVNAHLTNRRLQRELEVQVAELDAFARTVAHDLKSPLSRIVGGLDILEVYGGLTDEMKEMVVLCLRGAYDMDAIIEALLLLARVRQVDVLVEPLAMGQIVADAWERLLPMAEGYGAELFLPPVWPVARGYAPWIVEVWVNYLSNGLKYGGRPPRLQLGARVQEDGMVRFWIQDNGDGLTEEEQGQLFKEFTRLFHRVEERGHGLGLSIVRRILERLGGEVGVESAPGRGSAFYFCLPSA